MTGKLLVVAALLLTSLSQGAAAAEPPEQTSKNARKVLVVLAAVGMDDSNIKSLVHQIDSRVKDRYFTLTEERIADGTLKLHYKVDGSMGIDHLELRYTPDNSHFVYTARTDAVMVNYSFKF